MNNLFLNIGNNYKDLVTKVLADKATAEEIEMLKKWILQSEENKAYYNQAKNTWHIIGIIEKSNQFDTEAAWQKAKALIEKTKYIDNRIPGFNFQLIIRVAAIFILAFILGGAATYIGFRNKLQTPVIVQNSINEIMVPLGSKSQIYLPDSTMVWLNAGSKLRYAQDFNTTHRDVYLEGEAYFKVKTNPDKPFIVKTAEMNIKAFGTAFNVKAYPEERTITTILVEGIVKIESTEKSSKKFEIALEPNQKLTYIKMDDDKSLDPVETLTTGKDQNLVNHEGEKMQTPIIVDKEIKTNLYTSWKDDRWLIEGEELDNLTVMFERRFNVTFINKSEALKNYRISGIIRKETLEQVLDLLKLTTPLKYKINEGVVTLEFDSLRSENYSKVMN